MPKTFLQRFIFIVLFLIVFLLAITIKSFQVTIKNSEKATQTSNEEVSAIRGNIYDKYGNLLAVSVPISRVFLDPEVIIRSDDEESLQKIRQISQSLSEILELPQEEILEALASEGRYVLLDHIFTLEQGKQVDSQNMPGIGVEYDLQRKYPYGERFSHIIGFTGTDGNGLEGLEFSYNDQLCPEKNEDEVSSANDWFGYSLHLTMDNRVQRIARQKLSQSVEKWLADSGSIVIMDSFTGDIISMVNYPDFDPNNFSQYDSSYYRNRAITDYYEPGSVFKIFASAMLLQEKMATADSPFYCSGSIQLNNSEVKCIVAHDDILFRDILKKSCNVGMISFIEKISPQLFYDYLVDFGFGQKTGISLPGESSGRLKPFSSFTPSTHKMMAIGYEIGATLLQLARAGSAVVNGGMLMVPNIISKITDEEGNTIKEITPTHYNENRIISIKTAQELMDILRGVVEPGGTGTTANIEGIEIAGKTGTAQIYNPDTNQFENKYNATFLGFVPTPNSTWTIAICLSDPKLEYLSGKTAAPLFKEIVLEILNSGIIWDY